MCVVATLRLSRSPCNSHHTLRCLLFSWIALCPNAAQYGATALIYASNGGHAGIVQRLLAVGAALDPTDIDGRSALAFARKRSRANVITILEAAEAAAAAASPPGHSVGSSDGSGDAGGGPSRTSTAAETSVDVSDGSRDATREAVRANARADALPLAGPPPVSTTSTATIATLTPLTRPALPSPAAVRPTTTEPTRRGMAPLEEEEEEEDEEDEVATGTLVMRARERQRPATAAKITDSLVWGMLAVLTPFVVAAVVKAEQDHRFMHRHGYRLWWW